MTFETASQMLRGSNIKLNPWFAASNRCSATVFGAFAREA
ncbi:hypothetical protein CEV32_1435 [Brucella rhizosphaerae]|uniref:Uncharacterized protein n=1 Tax=Brucella rhizosphaerae TaxID=571254 RepID=A0A256F8K3_9HYPH|nr:hypothetical protein CEV32_1435 [Brucella rhizosphaerae]